MEITTALIGLLCTIISSAVTFFFTRRKYNAEVNSQQIDNINSSFDVYKKMTEETFELQNEKIQQLQVENSELRKQVHNLQVQMSQWINAVCYDTSCKLRQSGFPLNASLLIKHDSDNKEEQ